jgi:hypothetical protein
MWDEEAQNDDRCIPGYEKIIKYTSAALFLWWLMWDVTCQRKKALYESGSDDDYEGVMEFFIEAGIIILIGASCALLRKCQERRQVEQTAQEGDVEATVSAPTP